jgi:hypothetical protein
MERAGEASAPATGDSQLDDRFMNDHPTFEETYPKYEFSELVRLGVALAAWIVGMLHRTRASGPAALSAPVAENDVGAA